MWRSLSTHIFGRPLEIIADNRRNMPLRQFSSPIDGEMSFAATVGYKGEVVLSVWLEPFPKYSPVTLTHEIGHRILDLKGYRGLVRQPRNVFLEGLFNNVASHTIVYAFQRSIGHEPQTMIDSRCNHNINLCKEPKKGDPMICGLMLADDWLNTSYKVRQKLKWTLQKHQPHIWPTLERILKTTSQYDLSQPDTNLAFSKELVKELKIAGKWTENDEIERTKKLILEVKEKTTKNIL